MNERTEAMLREHLRSVDSAEVPPLSVIGDGVARVERRAARRRRGFAATSAIALVALAVGVVWNTSASPQKITGADGLPSTTIAPSSTSADTGPWAAIPSGPKPVAGATVVWTGTEAWMVGGTYPDGTVSGINTYNPTTQAWRVGSPDAALSGKPLVFWSGASLVVITSEDEFVLQYDALGQVIFRQSTGNAAAIDGTVPWAWTGAELFVWPTAVDALLARSVRAFDPFSGQWRHLGQSPIEPRSNAASIWTGTEWIIWGGSNGSTYFADGAAYNPTTETWRLLSEAPLSPRRAPAVWTGSEMILAAGFTGDPVSPHALADGAAYDPATDTWREISPGLAHPGFAPVWTGELMILFAKGGAVWYDPATDRWSSGEFTWGEIPHDSASPVWTGSVVLLLGSFGAESGGAVFTPPAD